MLFLIVLAFIASSNLVSNVAATGESTRIQSRNKEITKRPDGLMHELVNLLADEKFHRKTNEMVDRMVKQNEKILKQFAEVSKKIESFERKVSNATGNVKKITSEVKTLRKEVGDGKIEQNKTKWTVDKIKERIGDFNNKNMKQEINKNRLLTRQLESRMNTVNYKVTELKNAVSIKKGVVYVRWGKTRCPRDTRLVYSGYAAGAFYKEHAGSNTQCLPKDPKWRRYHDGLSDDAAYIHGAEYKIYTYSIGEALHKSYHNYKVPCAVCQSKKRLKTHMIPAKDRCSIGWHLEYKGYLMTQRYNQGASNYVCVDANPERIGSRPNQGGRLFYPVEGYCGSLPCPPYVHGRELTCAVCTF